MGALEEAVKAPWPNATPEEDAAYAKAAQMADSEFEREVVQQGGPQLEGYVDPDRAHLVDSVPDNVQGVYMPEGEPMTEAEKVKYGRLLDQSKVEEFEPGNTYAISAKNAKPDIWAHEFTHRRQDVLGLSPWMGKEKSATLTQAFRADNPQEWYKAVRVWHAYNKHKFQEDGQTLYDVEKHLKKTLESWQADLIRTEVEAREERSDRPKDRPGRFWGTNKGDLRRDAEEQAAIRAKSHDMKKYFDRIESEE